MYRSKYSFGNGHEWEKGHDRPGCRNSFQHIIHYSAEYQDQLWRKGLTATLTRKMALLYEAFPPDEAPRLAKRLEIHHTPKHGSWLDIAGIEPSALGSQCLANRRIGNAKGLNEESSAWNTGRDATQRGVDWLFTTADARIKLKHLYPILNF